MTRAERAAEALRLREEGFLLREIAERMDMPSSTVHDLVADPDLSKHMARRARYGGRCEDCGRPTDGSKGPKHDPPRKCGGCFHAARHAQARARIIANLQAFAVEHGRAPTADEWRVGAVEDTSNVQRVFGSWTAGLRAAGLEPKQRYPGDDPAVVAETVRLYRSGLSLAEVGRRLGCSGPTVHHRLVRAGAHESVRAA